MPLYEYKCNICDRITSEVRTVEERDKAPFCSCGRMTVKIISCPNLITDTNFGYTGKVDRRLGNSPIEGRRDFWNRAREKGLREVDLRDMDGSKTYKNRIEKAKQRLVDAMK